jgi:hypothetical protein
MKRRTWWMMAVMAVMLAFAAACSESGPGETPQAAGKQETASPGVSSPGGTAAPAGVAPAPAGDYALSLSPSPAFKESTLTLQSTGFRVEDADVVWLLNGEPVSTMSEHRFDTPQLEAGKGDTVQARARVADRDVLSNIVEIQNSIPQFTGVKIVPEQFGPGDRVGVEAMATDGDADPVSIQYEWTVNGEPAGGGQFLSTELKRGDTFVVSAKPFDGEDYGMGVTLKREIGNMPPMMERNLEYTFDGRTYTYTAKAADSDGDPLTYGLAEGAPEGMSIDPQTGTVTWKVPPDYLGTASFTVTASDGNGGTAQYTINFKLEPPAVPEEAGEQAKQ